MRIAAGSLVLLVLLTVAVSMGGPILDVDRAVAVWAGRPELHDWSHRALWIWWLGTPAVLVPLTFLIGAVILAVTRSWRTAALPVVAVGMAGAVATLMKWVLPSSRQKLDLARPEAFHAFPSGHTAATVALTTTLALGLAAGASRLVALFVAGLISVVMMMALVLSSAHWVTDIVGGVLVAVGAVAVTLTVLRPQPVGPEG